MDSYQFVDRYNKYLDEIQKVVKPEYIEAINNLREIDPHDLVSPETWFPNEFAAKGYVWHLFYTTKKIVF